MYSNIVQSYYYAIRTDDLLMIASPTWYIPKVKYLGLVWFHCDFGKTQRNIFDSCCSAMTFWLALELDFAEDLQHMSEILTSQPSDFAPRSLMRSSFFNTNFN